MAEVFSLVLLKLKEQDSKLDKILTELERLRLGMSMQVEQDLSQVTHDALKD